MGRDNINKKHNLNSPILWITILSYMQFLGLLLSFIGKIIYGGE